MSREIKIGDIVKVTIPGKGETIYIIKEIYNGEITITGLSNTDSMHIINNYHEGWKIKELSENHNISFGFPVFFSHIRDQDIEILKQMNDKEFSSACRLNKYINSLCDDNMWKIRTIYWFPSIINYKPQSASWKELYINFRQFQNILTKAKDIKKYDKTTKISDLKPGFLQTLVSHDFLEKIDPLFYIPFINWIFDQGYVLNETDFQYAVNNNYFFLAKFLHEKGIYPDKIKLYFNDRCLTTSDYDCPVYDVSDEFYDWLYNNFTDSDIDRVFIDYN